MRYTTKRHLIRCDCGSLNHYMELLFFADEPDFLYVSTLLNTNISFWKRVKQAFFYVFSKNRNYEEIVLSPREVMNLQTACDDFLFSVRENQ